MIKSQKSALTALQFQGRVNNPVKHFTRTHLCLTVLLSRSSVHAYANAYAYANGRARAHQHARDRGRLGHEYSPLLTCLARTAAVARPRSRSCSLTSPRICAVMNNKPHVFSEVHRRASDPRGCVSARHHCCAQHRVHDLEHSHVHDGGCARGGGSTHPKALRFRAGLLIRTLAASSARMGCPGLPCSRACGATCHVN